MLISAHATVYHILVVYHCSIAYLASFLIRVGGIVISCDSEVINDRQDMGGKEKVGDGRRQIRRGDMQKVSTYMDGIWQSFLLILHDGLRVTLYGNVHMYHLNSQLTA